MKPSSEFDLPFALRSGSILKLATVFVKAHGMSGLFDESRYSLNSWLCAIVAVSVRASKGDLCGNLE